MCYTLIGKHAAARPEVVEQDRIESAATIRDAAAAVPAATARRPAPSAFATFWRGLQEQLARQRRKEEESVS